jgi:hypothetical protein
MNLPPAAFWSCLKLYLYLQPSLIWRQISLTCAVSPLTISLLAAKLIFRLLPSYNHDQLPSLFLKTSTHAKDTTSPLLRPVRPLATTTKMAIHPEYYLEDFDEYANERIPVEYNALKACPRWVMEFKTIREGVGPLKRVPMLLVGRYFFSHGKQNAWAWATGTTIHYYHAHSGEEIVSTIKDLQNNKVYYYAPLNWAVGPQDTMHGMTKCRLTTKALAELVINFMFLLEDKILSVPNPGNTDLLSDFEYACRMFVMRRDEDRNDPRDEYFPYYGNAYSPGGVRGPGSRRSGGPGTSSTFSYIKDEPRDDDAPSSRLSGSPYRSTTSSTFKKPASTKSPGTPGRSRPSVHIKKERNDDKGAASVSWSGSSYASTPSRASSTSYLGMFAPNATTIRCGSGTFNDPFRLPPDRVTAKPRVSVSMKSS